MNELIMMATGVVYPLPVQENLTFSIDEHSDGSLDLNLTLAIPRPELEIEALKHRPVHISILESSPIVWLVMSFGDCKFDAPYVIGLEKPHVVARIQRAITVKKVATERQSIRFALVDLDTGILADLRFFYASAKWMESFATAVLRSPSHTPDEVRKVSVARDYKRWPNIGRMIKDAAFSEVVKRE